MINQQILQGNWNEIKGKIRSKWGQMTTDDVKSFDGNVDQLLGLIQRKTGEGRESIERFLNDLTANGASAVSQAADAVREYAHEAGTKIQAGVKQAAESVQGGYEEAEELVRRRPAESAAVCFGAGILTGLVVALMIHRR
ncbi:MAG: CsbD family protein [Planctomycetales bacterium]